MREDGTCMACFHAENASFQILRILVESFLSRFLPLGLFLVSVGAVAPNVAAAFSAAPSSSASSLVCLLLLLVHLLATMPGLLRLATGGKEEVDGAYTFLSRLWKVAAAAVATGSPEAALAVAVVYLEQDGLVDQVKKWPVELFTTQPPKKNRFFLAETIYFSL